MKIITILIGDDDGEALLQLLGDGPKFQVMSMDLVETAPRETTVAHRTGSIDKQKGVVRPYSDLPLGQLIFTFAEQQGRIHWEESQQVAANAGYAESSGPTYLSGLTREGKLRMVGSRRDRDRYWEVV